MISADEARALINRQSYKEKIKEYEEKIEKNIVRAAKNNESMIVTLHCWKMKTPYSQKLCIEY